MHPIPQLIEPKILNLVQLFLKNQNTLYHLSEIAEQSKTPLSTTHRLIIQLQDIKLIDTILVGKTKLYKTNKKVAKQLQVLK